MNNDDPAKLRARLAACTEALERAQAALSQTQGAIHTLQQAFQPTLAEPDGQAPSTFSFSIRGTADAVRPIDFLLRHMSCSADIGATAFYNVSLETSTMGLEITHNGTPLALSEAEQAWMDGTADIPPSAPGEVIVHDPHTIEIDFLE